MAAMSEAPMRRRGEDLGRTHPAKAAPTVLGITSWLLLAIALKRNRSRRNAQHWERRWSLRRGPAIVAMAAALR